ncbi:MAG: adenylyltransferase/cytidyltransferase family protein [Chloroflexi bacterium]|nr:adenylyltransferase/cytidyltransferase family protein [Chloroflexota bacterium]
MIESIHSSSGELVIAAAGGGTGAIAALARVPGASRTLLHAVVPYSKESMRAYLGYEPRSLCSKETAADMARRARDMGMSRITDQAATLIGVGVTAALTTDRPRRGRNRCFVSITSASVDINRWIDMRKGARSRIDEEELVDKLVLNCIAEAFGVTERTELGLLPGERVEDFDLGAAYWYERLVDSRASSFRRDERGRLSDRPVSAGAMLPGSFDPLHRGHIELVRVAADILDTEVAFELSVSNVDKPVIDLDELERRLSQFTGVGEVLVTSAPTFVEKARILPERAFVIGADTAPRVVDRKYYGGSQQEMLAALDELSRAGCRFLVAGRSQGPGVFTSLGDVEIPAEYRHMFESILESRYRVDISSTELREQAGRTRS